MKKCPECGAEYPDTNKFCLSCGTPLVEKAEEAAPAPEAEEAKAATAQAAQAAPVQAAEAAPAEAPVEAQAANQEPAAGSNAAGAAPGAVNGITEKIKKLPGYVLPLAGVAVVALIIILIAACSGGGSSNILGKNTIGFAYSDTEECYIVYNADGKTVQLEDITRISSYRYNSDHSAAYFIDDDTLYYVTIKGATEIEEDVDKAYISQYGDSIAYVTDVNLTGLGDLYLYNVKKGEATLVESDVYANNVCLSPDGKSIAYMGDFEGLTDFKAMISVNGKEPELIAKTAYPVAIANKGKYIYYSKQDGLSSNLYVAKGEDSNKLAADLYGSIDVYFNADCSQILYSYDGKTYLSTKAGEKQKISNRELDYLIPGEMEQSMRYESATANITVMERDSLAGSVLELDNEIYYMTKDDSVEKIFSDYSVYLFNEDQTGVIYLDNENLYLVKNFTKSTEKVQLTDDAEISYFTANSDLSAVYYLDDEDTLYYQKGTRDAKKLADDVHYSLAMDRAEGILLYFVDYDRSDSMGDLYYSKNGSKKKLLEEGVKSTEFFAGSLFLYKEGEDGMELSIAKSGTKFKLLLEGLE